MEYIKKKTTILPILKLIIFGNFNIDLKIIRNHEQHRSCVFRQQTFASSGNVVLLFEAKGISSVSFRISKKGGKIRDERKEVERERKKERKDREREIP